MTEKDFTTYSLGIDLGSTTVKYVLLTSQGEILDRAYVRHQSAVIPTLIKILEDLALKHPNTLVKVSLTGSSALALCEAIQVTFVQEVIAASSFLKHLKEGVDVSIELGGEDGKILFLSGGMELRMNEACAGGTGAFIDQMATLLNTDAQGLNEMAKKATKTFPIASRCGVFAKTDLVALLNQGVSREDIAKSIFNAVCEQTISGLACGRAIEGNVALLGGPLSFLTELKASFVERLASEKTHFIETHDGQYAIATGAALELLKQENDPLILKKPQALSLEELITRLQEVKIDVESEALSALFNNPSEYQEFKERHAQERLERIELKDAEGDLFLGVDLGSTTVKGVLIDSKQRLIESFYDHNGGSPLEKLLPKISEILEKLKDNPGVRIAAICTTGYGADLAKAALNAQFTEVETLAHQKAACNFDPETSYVIDIGGQDMKCIKVKDGIIKGMALNEACSSGCGSFIETFAKQLNLPLNKFIDEALSSKHPTDLGTRCTVFMNSKVKQAQRDSVPISDIASGLCLSIVRNALYKVLRIHDSAELGDHVVVQGGTFLNDAILRAFEMHIGKNVIRPDIAGLMGAFGAALIAKERFNVNEPLNLKSEFLDLSAIKIRQFRCRGCNNHCLLTMNTFLSGQKHIHGNRCDFALKTSQKNKESEEFIEFKLDTLFNREVLDPKTAPRGVIGIPRVLNIFEHYPYWHKLFTELGFAVVLSPLSTKEIAELGNVTIPSQSLCYPAKLTHGHVTYLAKLGIKDIFLPCVPREAKIENNPDSYACPVVGGYPEALKLNVIQDNHDLKIHTPFLDLTKNATVLRAIFECFKDKDLKAHEVKKAIKKARASLDEYRQIICKKGDEIYQKALEEGKPLVVLAGRPYHIDPLINHGIPSLISSLGARVVSEDAIYNMAKRSPKLDVVNQWAFHSRLYKAADVAVEKENVQFVQLVSFGCGIDAITSEQVKKILEGNDKIYTMLKIDEGDTLGAARIRLKSLLCAVDENARTLHKKELETPYVRAKKSNMPDSLRSLYIPQMAPIHFPILTKALGSLGYSVKLLETVSDEAIELGLKHVNNDACYPAIVVIGQLLDALKKGEIDQDKSALLLAQTCGPCRATNYPALLKWALNDLKFDNVPIVTLSSYDLNTDALKLKLGMKGLYTMMKGILLGDLIQKLYFHTKTYEKIAGEANKALSFSSQIAQDLMAKGKRAQFKACVTRVIEAFSKIKLREETRPKVGIVGEILLKYHPKANLDLMNKIIEEGAEPVLGDIASFVLYCLNDSIYQARYMKGSWMRATGSWLISARFNKMRQVISKALKNSPFGNLTPFSDYKKAIEGLISAGQQAGEGWLLTAEMIDFIEHDVNNVLCVQPFACLPNHVTGKGVMRAIRMMYKNANLCAIDFEAGTAQSNVANRLKLFITQAKEIEFNKKAGLIHFQQA